MDVIDSNQVTTPSQKKTATQTISSKQDIFTCSNCKKKSLSKTRHFSPQAWQALILWKEIDKPTITKPLCDFCYKELRVILIDRSAEVDLIESK